MISNKKNSYGIKYKVVKLDKNNYFLFPFSLVGGLSDNNIFTTDVESYKILNNKKDLLKN